MIFKRPSNEEESQYSDDYWLIEQAKSDPTYFGLLYERFFHRIYNYCLRRLDSPEDAEDITSLVFVRAFASLSHFKGGSVAAWLFRIAHNSVANQLRARRPQVSLELAAAGENHWPGLLENSGESLLDGLLRQEEKSQLATWIADLPLEQRELLTLSIAGGLTAREVGQVLGKSEGAVWKAFQRIIQRLRERYSQYAGLKETQKL